MEDMILRESLIFSKKWKEDDIIKIMRFEEDKKKSSANETNLEEGIEHDEKIDIKEYSDLTDEFVSIFNQKDIEQLNNDIKLILDYFYFRELLIDQYIDDKYKNNDKKRHLNIRLADYLLRVQFEENESICETAKLINALILEVNESYIEQNNLNDLSDKTYLDKVSKVLGTNEIPRFLLRDGYRLRRQIQKNKELFLRNFDISNENNKTNTNAIENKNENENSNKDKIENKNEIVDNNELYSDKENGNSSEEEKKKIIKKEQYSIKNISQEIENKQKLPFERNLNEIYLMLFLLSLKEIGDKEVYKTIRNNLNGFFDFFQIKKCLNLIEFKKKYIDFNEKDLSTEIVEMEFSELNKSEYLCKYIISSYNVLIKKILRSQNDIYINLLLYLQKYIKPENDLLRNIVENELNSVLLSDSKDKNSNYRNSLLCDRYKYNYNNIISDTFKNINFIVKSITENQHKAKYFDYYTIKNAFDFSIDNKIKKRFYEVIKKEKSFEVGSNSFFLNVLKLFKPLYKMKKQKDDNTIENHLKLIPYQKQNYKEKTVLILISGYFSSNDDHFKEWNELIKVYKKKFRTPIIYFFNWPSSKFKLSKIFYHQKDFKNARERGKYCGRLLALMIMSNKFFNGSKINLAAFSLGNHVIKHCIKEIEKFGRFDILNNIIFMAGATDIKCNFKWEKRLSSILGAVINCYSDIDLALGYCKLITGKDTIGTKKLKFKNKNVKNYLISSIHVLYRINMDIIGKLFIDDLKV